jgi:hypothetical protein
MILAAREGKISMLYISVEHSGTELYNPATRQMESDEIIFLGSATVNQGACRKCRLHEAGSIQVEPPIQEEETLTDNTKELEEIAALKKEIELLKMPKEPEPNKELEAALVAIKELTAQVETLKKEPAPAVTVQKSELKELGTVETVAIWNPKEGTIRSV